MRRSFVARLTALLVGLVAPLPFAAPARALDPTKALHHFVRERWSSESGLPQNSVSALAQTRDGYLWMGTYEGVVRFDGIAMRVLDRDSTPALRHSDVRALAPEPASGAIWVGTYGGGLTRLDGERATHVGEAEGLSDPKVLALARAADGALLVGTTQHAFRVSGDRAQRIVGLPDAPVNALHVDADGTTWLGSDKGLYRLVPGGQGATRVFPPLDRVTALARDRRGRLWIGTDGHGLHVDDGRVLRREDAFGSEAVRALREDASGALWVATGAGIFRYSNGKWGHWTSRQGLADDATLSLFEDAEANMWIGTLGAGAVELRDGTVTTFGAEDGLGEDIMVRAVHAARGGGVWAATERGGLYKLRDGRFERTTLDVRAGESLLSLHEDKDGTVWVGTRTSGVLRMRDGQAARVENLPGDTVYVMIATRDGAVWVGTGGAGVAIVRGNDVRVLSSKDGLAGDIVRDLLEDKDGAVWVATDSGLARVFGDTVTRFGASDGVPDVPLSSLHRASDGALLIGTYGGGLVRIDGPRTTRFRRRDGLFDDNVFRILEDDAGYLWTSSNRGIARARLAELAAVASGTSTRLEPTTFRQGEGMRSAECNGGMQPAGTRAEDGGLYFATIAGVARVFPSRVVRNEVRPRVVLEGISIDGHAAPLGGRSVVPPAASQLELRYAAPSFVDAQAVRYEYILEGLDTDWVQAGPRRIAYYAGVPPGEYRFRVRAYNATGIAGANEASLVVVRPPRFWQTAWFYGLALVLAGGSAFGAHRLRLRALDARARRLENLVAAQTSTLKEQRDALETARDELTAKNGALEQAHALVVAADAQKTRFFQNVSHEFRTPLTLILAPTDELVGEQEVPDPRLVMIAANARRLLRLVNQLLELQRLSAGKRTLILAPLDLRAFADACARAFEPACARRGITFVHPRGDDGEARIVARVEVDALEKIVFNFLSNALKFTPAGGRVTLAVEPVVATHGADARARIAVTDTGPGIAEEAQGGLFRVFGQVARRGDDALEGSGLGLALARELAEAMNGTVGLRSGAGEGATFWVELPAGEGEEAPSEAQLTGKDWHLAGVTARGSVAPPEDDDEVDSRKRVATVLVVDDLPAMRELIRRTLRKAHYHVLLAENGRAALAVASRERVDLIVSDWMMPELGGPGLVRAIKSNPRLASIPVVLLTARSDEESKALGTELGADAFLGKPFNDVELVGTVRNLLMLKEREHQIEELNRNLTENVLKRFLPAPLVDDIIEGHVRIDQAPQTRDVTVLFADIVGFTDLSSRVPTDTVAEVLNAFLDRMTTIIFEHGGTIDKFIGDGIMVLFGAPLAQEPPEQARRAVACALAMQRAMRELGARWSGRGLPDLRMRIGGHFGPALVGSFGSARRSDYTAIGRTVNLAARIEGACPAGEVLISGEIAAYLAHDAVDEAGAFRFKGIPEPVLCFRVRPRLLESVRPAAPS